jgi:ankyrin repeat protein
MNLSCLFGHNWKGCKCTRCGKTRDMDHDWSKDCEHCSMCNKTRTDKHDWSKDCVVCAVCGKTRTNRHVVKGCTCQICGKEFHKWDGCICIKCGKIRSIGHDTTRDCKRCSRCNTYFHDNTHVWKDYHCTKCGFINIFASVEQNSITLLKRLISEGANVNATRHEGVLMTDPLSLALEQEYPNIEILKILIDAGADVNNPYDECSKLLRILRHVSIYHNCNESVVNAISLLLKAGARIDKYEDDVLFSAAELGITDLVREALENGVKATPTRCLKWVGDFLYSEPSPLLLAIRGRHEEIVELLLRRGADVDPRLGIGSDNYYHRPIIAAIHSGESSIVRALLEYGADKLKDDRFGSGNGTLLTIAATEGNHEIVDILIQHGVSLRRSSNGGWTPLKCAAAGGHEKVVKKILAAGVDISNQQGESAVCAAANGHLGVVKILLSSGVDVNSTGDYLMTPLMGACLGGKLDIAKYLVSNGADIWKVNRDNESAFDIAKRKGHKEIANWLSQQKKK